MAGHTAEHVTNEERGKLAWAASRLGDAPLSPGYLGLASCGQLVGEACWTHGAMPWGQGGTKVKSILSRSHPGAGEDSDVRGT